MRVNRIYKTIQGEGVLTGVPMLILRLQGCHVGCAFCVDGKTQVLMADWTSKPIDQVVIGDFVMSYDTKRRHYKVSRVLYVSHRNNAEVVRVVAGGKTTICTPDHVFHTNRRRSAVCRMRTLAADLTGMCISETILGKHIDPLSEEDDDYRMGYLMGAYAGDGGTSAYQGYVKLHWQQIDKDFCDRIAAYLNHFGKHVNVRPSSRKTKRGKTVWVTGTTLRNIEFVMGWPENESQSRGYIAGFFDAEGTVAKTCLSISQQDKKLLARVQKMIEAFGFSASLLTCPDPRGNPDMHNLLLHGGRSEVERFFAEFNPAIARKRTKVYEWTGAQLAPVPVESVTPGNSQRVYNLMTTQGNFFANGFLVDQCDTRETWNASPGDQTARLDYGDQPSNHWAEMSESEIVTRCIAACGEPRGIDWILLTGGEPAEQDLRALVHALHQQRFKVALETSGTALGHLDAKLDWICVSPKIMKAAHAGLPVLQQAVYHADEVKMVICTQDDLAAFDAWLEHTDFHIRPTFSLQPVSNQHQALKLCMDTCMTRGWRLSVQTHKLLALP